MIPFNKPFFTGNEIAYIEQAVASGKISGDGVFTQKCHAFFEQYLGTQTKAFLTTSCSTALDMMALLLNIVPGDEVIMPSYTFSSTANAFVLRGAQIVFADSEANNPNIDAGQIEALITPKTRAVVAMHYAGVACNMNVLCDISKQYKLFLLEDAAQAIASYYKGQPLGSIGQMAAFSFHETKNVIAGEGGLFALNDPQFCNRAEIIREKGTNRTAFFRGDITRYEWVDIGSSFLPSEIVAAFLYAQLENLETIQQKRLALWNAYNQYLQPLQTSGYLQLPFIPDYATCNGHIFYVVCPNLTIRNKLLNHLQSKGVYAVFHYLALHQSPYYRQQQQQPNNSRALPNADRFEACLLRLPLYYELSIEEVAYIVAQIEAFFAS